MHSAIYTGRVRHRRFEPAEHAFSYRVFQVYLDLAELDSVFRGRWLWSTQRSAVARFKRSDHHGDAAQPLDESIRDLVQQDTGTRPTGPIRLLTHLRYFGYVMNPVSMYYCFDDADERLETVVAEVHNTPWGERHCYVLPRERSVSRGGMRFRFAKAFHVSPFMPMEQIYDWRFGEPGDKLAVHMENFEHGRKLFDATMSLQRRPICTGNLAKVLMNHPFMTGKVIAAIYWNALKLRLKGVAFHPHPKWRTQTEAP